MILHWPREDGKKVNFRTLYPDGSLDTNYIADSAAQGGNVQVGVDYLEAVARLIPGSRVKDRKPLELARCGQSRTPEVRGSTGPLRRVAGRDPADDGRLQPPCRGLTKESPGQRTRSVSRQRIPGPDSRKTGKVAVPRPEFAGSVFQDKRRDVGVVDEVAGRAPHRGAWNGDAAHATGPSPSITSEGEASSDSMSASALSRSVGGSENPVVGNHPQELPYAGPGQRPRLIAIREPTQDPVRAGVIGEFPAIRVDQQVGVQRDQSRPSITSKSASRSSSRTPGPQPSPFRPPPETVAGFPRASLQAGTKRPLHHGAKGRALAGRAPFRAAKEFVVQVHSRSHGIKTYPAMHEYVTHGPRAGSGGRWIRRREGHLAGAWVHAGAADSRSSPTSAVPYPSGRTRHAEGGSARPLRSPATPSGAAGGRERAVTAH